MNLKNAIGKNAYWMINKKLAQEIGLEATLVLQHLIDIEDSFFGLGNEFYQQKGRLMKDLFLNEKKLEKCISILKDKKFISIIKKGLPAKNYYTLHHDEILVFICEQQVSPNLGQLESPIQDSQRLTIEKTKATTVVTSEYEFTSEREQIKIRKEILRTENNLDWNKLLSLWCTNEFAGTLKKIKTTYWDKITSEDRKSILKMIEDLGSDKEHLQKIWISDCFKNKKMNSVSLRKEIELQKLRSTSNTKPGQDLTNFNNF